MFADFLGFPYTQAEIMNHASAHIEKGISLDLVHATVAPPTKKTLAEIAHGVMWFSERLRLDKASVITPLSRGPLIRPNTLNVVFGLQHPPEDVTSTIPLRHLRNLGVVFMTLAYKLDSVYGGGFANPLSQLTDHGRRLLRFMGKAGTILDLSHASARTAVDALEFIEAEQLTLPVVASHAGCYEVYQHPRNLHDAIMKGIKEMGGLIGIPTCTFMLSADDNSLVPFVRHIAHALEIVGEDFVTIGSDGIYKTLNPKKQHEIFDMMAAKIDPRENFKARFPTDPPELNSPRRMEIIHALLESEFGLRIANKVCGENLVKLLVAHLF